MRPDQGREREYRGNRDREAQECQARRGAPGPLVPGARPLELRLPRDAAGEPRRFRRRLAHQREVPVLPRPIRLMDAPQHEPHGQVRRRHELAARVPEQLRDNLPAGPVVAGDDAGYGLALAHWLADADGHLAPGRPSGESPHSSQDRGAEGTLGARGLPEK